MPDHSARPENAASPAAQQLASSMHNINETAFAQRRELLDTVDLRLESSRTALKQIQKTAKDSRADARADFKASLNEAKAREKDLDAALKASKKADAANWEIRRAALAKASDDYTAAMTKLEGVSHLPKP